MEHDNDPAAAAASVDHAAHAALLDDLMARIAPCFARRETRLTCRDMVNGLLSELDDHNCWTLAEAAGHASPYRMQHLLSRARVDDRQLLDAAADWAAAHITAGQDESDVMLIVDETADEKSSSDCVIWSPIFDVFAVNAAGPGPRRGQVIWSTVNAEKWHVTPCRCRF